MTIGYEDNPEISLSIEVLSYKDRPPVDAAVCVFNQEGGSIGRSEDNRCVLPDPEGVVSRVHARILYRDGRYLLIDQSTNGTFVNDPSSRLADGVEYEIRAGDRFILGDYVVLARLEEAVMTEEAFQPVSQATLVDPSVDFVSDEAADRFTAPGNEPAQLEGLGDSLAGNVRRPDWFPEGGGSEVEVAEESGANGEHPVEQGPTPVLQHHMPPPGGRSKPISDEPSRPQTAVPTGYIPFADQLNDFAERQLQPDEAPIEQERAWSEVPQRPAIDEARIAAKQTPIADEIAEAGPTLVEGLEDAPLGEELQASSPSPAEQRDYEVARETPRPVARAAEFHSASDAGLLRAFVDGLGVAHLPVAEDQLPTVMKEFGRLTHEVIQGLIETLRLRAEFKREFYVPATSIGPVENNIFKYSVNVDDAISRMFSDSAEAYLSPVDSARQSFQDIAAHHLAMVAGMQAAVTTLLEKFSPDLLRERLGKGSVLEGVLPQYRKARMWEQFENEYKKIAEQAQEDFQRVFGQSFSQAYTQQVMRLQAIASGGDNKDE